MSHHHKKINVCRSLRSTIEKIKPNPGSDKAICVFVALHTVRKCDLSPCRIPSLVIGPYLMTFSKWWRLRSHSLFPVPSGEWFRHRGDYSEVRDAQLHQRRSNGATCGLNAYPTQRASSIKVSNESIKNSRPSSLLYLFRSISLQYLRGASKERSKANGSVRTHLYLLRLVKWLRHTRSPLRIRFEGFSLYNVSNVTLV